MTFFRDGMRLSRRGFLVCSALAPTLRSARAATGNPVAGGHIVEGNATDISNLNPIYVSDVYSQSVAYRLYEPLLSFDNQANLLPNLVTELPKTSADGTVYTFNLRGDVLWSDGRPLTADDVVFHYQLMFDPKWKESKSRFRAQAEQYIRSVVAVDPRTVVITTTTPYAPFLSTFCTCLGGGGILPKHVWETLQPAEMFSSPLNNLPTVVSGAMLPLRWDKGSQYVLQRNNKWFAGRTHIEQYIFRVSPGLVENATLLRTGEIDIGAVDPSVWDSMADADAVNRVGFVRPAYDYYIPNLDASKNPKAAFFGDVAVRRALYMALDRKVIADKVYFGQAQPADSIMSPAQWAHVAPPAQYPFDPDKANRMLEDAGWKKGADGVRSKNGMRMEWQLSTNAGNAVRQTLITVMADQWQQLGVKVSTQTIQFPQLVTQLTQTRDFDMLVLGINENLDPDQTQYYNSKSIGSGALNGSGYRNPAVDKLLDEGVQTVDVGKRKQIYAQLQQILMEDVPTPSLTFPKGLFGVSRRVANFDVGPWTQYGSRPWFKDLYVLDGK